MFLAPPPPPPIPLVFCVGCGQRGVPGVRATPESRQPSVSLPFVPVRTAWTGVNVLPAGREGGGGICEVMNEGWEKKEEVRRGVII